MTDESKTHLREVSLKMSRDLNPNVPFQSNMTYGLTNSSVPPTIEKVLGDADKIYNWLIKQK